MNAVALHAKPAGVSIAPDLGFPQGGVSHKNSNLDAFFDSIFAQGDETQEMVMTKDSDFRNEASEGESVADIRATEKHRSMLGAADTISDREVAAARKNPEFLYQLWLRIVPSVKLILKNIQRMQKHTDLDDLMQEAFEAFHKAIHAYDGRSSGAFVAYYRRYALHTKIRNYSAHDRVIPVPHDTRGSRQSWHRVSESTVQARISAQDLAWPDATEDSGWDTFQSEGDMEEQVVNSMDEEILKQKVLCLPRRWRDLLLLWQRYDNQRIAELTGMSVQEIQDIQNTAMNILRLFGKDRFWVGRTEADYLREWHGLTSQDQGDGA